MSLHKTGLLLAFALLPAHGPAQSPSLLTLGVRVRLWPGEPAPSPFRGRERIVGHLTRIGNDSVAVLDLDVGREITLPLASVARLEVSHGTRSAAGRGAFIGLIAGTVTGIASGLVLCGVGDCSSSGGEWTGAVVLVLGAGGALGGTGLGAIVGALVRTERWQAVGQSEGAAAAPPVQRHFGLSFRF